LAAEYESLAIQAQFEARRAAGDDSGEPPDRIWELDKIIAKTPPVTLAGAAVKLRRLLDPDLGMEIGESEDDFPSIRQVLSLSSG